MMLRKTLSFAVSVLIASIQLAVEIVTTTALAMGSRSLSHHSAIVTRLAAIEGRCITFVQDAKLLYNCLPFLAFLP